MKFRFNGPSYRVQLTVYDWSDSVDAFKDDPTTFCVKILSKATHVNTKFSSGECVYYGKSSMEAWEHVRRYVPEAKVNRPLKKYFPCK